MRGIREVLADFKQELTSSGTVEEPAISNQYVFDLLTSDYTDEVSIATNCGDGQGRVSVQDHQVQVRWISPEG